MVIHSTNPTKLKTYSGNTKLAEVGVRIVAFNTLVYVEDKDKYLPEDEVPAGARVLNLSGTELRQRLNEGRDLPGWFTYSDVAQELRRSFPPRHKRGVTIFFSGLSGAGKSTIANVLAHQIP
jgi:sulfate adenylyltransferase